MKDINKKDLRPINNGLFYDTKRLTVEEGLRRQVRELKSRIVILETEAAKNTIIEKFSQIEKLTAENREQAKIIHELEAHSNVLIDCIC